MSLSMIVAVDRDGAIGRGGDLLYHIPADLRRFKALTLGHPVIMGRRTFESLPGGPLPGRLNIVVSRTMAPRPDVTVVRSLPGAIEAAGGADAYIIGGASLYREAQQLAGRLELTQIDASTPGADTHWPDPAGLPAVTDLLPDAPWQRCPRTGLRYRFVTLRRR